MAKKVEVDFFGEKCEMFKGNSHLADINVMLCLLAQIRDGMGELDFTVYDRELKHDWSMDEILDYIRDKYEDDLRALADTTAQSSF